MRITRIDRIRNHKVFRDFKWESLEEFKHYNLIYGWNGTGKTLLSNLFRAIEKRTQNDPGVLEITVEGRQINSDQFATDPRLPQVRVFNKDFVKENVFTTTGTASPIFVLGEESVEKQTRIEKLGADLNTMVDGLSTTTQEKTSAETELDNYCIAQAKAIKILLSSSGTNRYNNYDKSEFRTKADALIASGDHAAFVLDEPTKEALRKKKDATRKEKSGSLSFGFLDPDELHKTVAQTLATTVVSKVIDALRDDPDLAAWVKNGLDLHRDRHTTTCLFCGNTIREQRLKALDQHFSQQYEQFIGQLDEMIASLDTRVDEAQEFSLPEKANLYDHLADDYESARNKLIQQVAEYRQFLVQIREHLERKKERPFEALSCSSSPPDVKSTHLDQLNTTIATHNQETDGFDSTVRDARSKLEGSNVAESIASYKELTESIKHLADKIDAEGTQVKRFQDEINALERQIVENRKSAEELNRDIEAYLGRSEIQLSVDEAEPGYKLMRDGQLQAADSLSEGERTAIAFLYFLMSLKEKDFKLNEGIVVIDDPVSSLDANAMFAAFAFMKERTESAGQLFVLTHNFAFFREVKNWFWHANRGKKKEKHKAAFYQIVCVHDGADRNSHLRSLDRLLRDYDSEYHYLFSLICKAVDSIACDDALATWYHYPNIARRVLESFLAFHWPRTPRTGEGLKAQLQSVALASEKKARILRFLHTHSHAAEIDEGEHDASILSETPQVLKDVLDLIESGDRQHFNEMKRLVASSEDAVEETTSP